jgi:hypothetical protein
VNRIGDVGSYPSKVLEGDLSPGFIIDHASKELGVAWKAVSAFDHYKIMRDAAAILPERATRLRQSGRHNKRASMRERTTRRARAAAPEPVRGWDGRSSY